MNLILITNLKKLKLETLPWQLPEINIKLKYENNYI